MHLGSGIAEAACKTVVNMRAKRTGMCWTPDGLDAVLAPRTAVLNETYDDFWEDQLSLLSDYLQLFHDPVGKFGIDQLDQATDDEKRRMKQAEQAKAFPENMMPVEKPNRYACTTRKSLLCNMSCCLLFPV